MVQFCTSQKCLVGKTAIVTGANSGIGFETALDFAKRGCRVILACRNQEKANAARSKIIAATGNQSVVVRLITLESLTSVREFAKNINETEERLDILVNNAGVVSLPEKVTEDGLQLQMVVNYFSHFLLTNLLLDLLKKSAPSRVINVSSVAAELVQNLNLNELNKYHKSDWYFYGKSKLCQIYFTQELAKRLEGSGVTTYSLHPGVVSTEFQKNISTVFHSLSSIFFKKPVEGAQTTIYTALEDGIEKYSGEHFENCQRVKPYCAARDPEKARKLWEISEKMVGL